MENTAPFEILATPFTVWRAPVGEAFPDVDTIPAGGWVKVGTSGDLNYGEDGVTITHEQEVSTHRALGSTGPRKAFRVSERQVVSFVLNDLSLEQYRTALNQNTVTTTAPGAGTPGTKDIGLSRGLAVEEMSLLLRADVSPAGDGWKMQYEIPRAVEIGSPEVVFRKGEPAGLALEFETLEDTAASVETERFGRLVIQTAAAS
jgi:hypothetical protein